MGICITMGLRSVGCLGSTVKSAERKNLKLYYLTLIDYLAVY